jgi:hypothetical protein
VFCRINLVCAAHGFGSVALRFVSADGGNSRHWRLSQNIGTKGPGQSRPSELLKFQEATKLYALGIATGIACRTSKGAAEGDLSGLTNNPDSQRPSKSSRTAASPWVHHHLHYQPISQFSGSSKPFGTNIPERFFTCKQTTRYTCPPRLSDLIPSHPYIFSAAHLLHSSPSRIL